MTLDIFLVVMTFTLVILYVVFQVIFFRFLPKSGVIKWLVYLYGFLLGLSSIGSLAAIRLIGISLSWDLILGGFFIIGLLFALSCVWYICPVFGIIESSMRMHMLREIARHGDKGMSKQELNKIYNIDIIIQKRLDRFVASGEVVRDGAHYRKSNRLAFFPVAGFLFSFIFWLYGGKVADKAQ